jgi:hypothetical protein
MPPRPRPKPSASNQRAPILPAPVEEENIDINVSDTSEVDNEDTPAPGKARATPVNAPGDEKTISDEAPILPANREPFTKESLLRYIRNFIVADDQVSFNWNSIFFILTGHFSP